MSHNPNNRWLDRLCEAFAYYFWPTLQIVWTVRVPFFVSALLCTLFFIDQNLEALRVMAASSSTQYNWQYWFGCLAASLVSLGAWYFSRLLLEKMRYDTGSKGFAGFLIRHVPRVLGASISLSFGVAAWAARVEIAENLAMSKMNRNLTIILLVQLTITGVLYWFFLGRDLNQVKTASAATPQGLFDLNRKQWLPVLFAHSVWFLLLILFAAIPVKTGRFLGPTAVLIFGVGAWIPIGSFISFASMLKRVPFTSGIVLLAFIFTFFDGNDNHRVRTLSSTPNTVTVSNYFNRWLSERTQNDTNAYPVFLVATEGGGIRASYNTAMVLGELQDRHTNFFDHVFSISGISGGSIGAAMITAHWKDRQADPANSSSFKDYATKIFTQDFLSPLLGMGLFPDLFQRFFFSPIPWFDRALALEYGFEQAHAKLGINSLTNSFFDWHIRGNRLGPALLLNTTHVKSGRRMAFSPFTSDSFGLSRPLSLSDVSDAVDVSLRSAMVLSARFPVFTPPGFFEKTLLTLETNGTTVKTHSVSIKHRLVDGGYFENSGTATLLDLFEKLQRIDHHKKCRLYIIRIGHRLPASGDVQIKDKGLKEKTALPRRETEGFDELSPVLALLNVREARGNNASKQLEEAYDRQYSTPVIDFFWEEKDVPLPLGWLISQPACQSLDKQFYENKKAIGLVGAALRFPD